MSAINTPASVFVAYSHLDEDLKDDLLKHLGALFRSTGAHCWHDRRIEPGQDWQQEIDRHLDEAPVVLLLVSSDFISSDYRYGVEMRRALERHDACVIPVIVRPCDWHSLGLSKLQAVPKDGKAVTLWNNRDEAMTDAAKRIRLRVVALHHKTLSCHQPLLRRKFCQVPRWLRPKTSRAVPLQHRILRIKISVHYVSQSGRTDAPIARSALFAWGFVALSGGQ